MNRSSLAAAQSSVLDFIRHAGGLYILFRQTLYWSTLGPFREKTEYRRQVFPLMEAIGNRSFAIVALVSFLIGAILVLQTGYVLEKYGQINQVAGLVAVSITRELGPLMTAIVIVARVGAAFTAGIGTMTISEEVVALRIMGINPVGFLVAPRFLAIFIMLPCLTIFANVIGIGGGLVMASLVYDIAPWTYINSTLDFLLVGDLVSGVAKAALFSMVICIVSCYMALRVEGGPEGLARTTMVSVVTSLVLVVFFDGLATAFQRNVF